MLLQYLGTYGIEKCSNCNSTNVIMINIKFVRDLTIHRTYVQCLNNYKLKLIICFNVLFDILQYIRRVKIRILDMGKRNIIHIKHPLQRQTK